MASAGNLDMAVIPLTVAVASETDPGTVYQVQLPYCPCKDWRYRRASFDGDVSTLFCKHLLTGLERVSGWHRKPEVHEGIPRVAVREYLASQPELSDSLIDVAVDSAVLGSPSIIPAQGKRGEIRIEVIRERRPRLYTVTLSA
jgi:hypothetical protein